MREPAAEHRGDHLSPAGRSRVMAAIRRKDTKPELELRAALRALGATGYRLHRRDIAGRPDLAFLRWRVAVFVDGAYWHGHPDHFDESRASNYWRAKMRRNRERDELANASLAAAGWTVLRAWDFEVKADAAEVAGRVFAALEARGWPG